MIVSNSGAGGLKIALFVVDSPIVVVKRRFVAISGSDRIAVGKGKRVAKSLGPAINYGMTIFLGIL